MLLFYAFALIVGGGLLGASLLLGGHHEASGADVHGVGGHDAHVGVGGHHEGSGADVHGGGHGHGAHAGHETPSEANGGFDYFWLMFLSIRFWTFFLAFFGLTGLVLQGLSLLQAAAVLPVAVAMGLGSGAGISYAVRALGSRESTSAADAEEFVGKTARVLIAVSRDSVGKVRLLLKGQHVDVVATTDEPTPLGPEEEALVVEMRGTTAVLARQTSEHP